MKRPLKAALWLFFFLSGATGLLYEIVWMRQLILVFGSTTHAVSAVLSAFMLGLALGSFGFGRLSDRGANLVRSYGLLEIGVGLYALVAPFLLAQVAPLFVRVLGQDPTPGPLSTGGRFVGSLLILVPPTVLMGGTLPVLSKLFSTPGRDYAGSVGRLYAVNTFGAVAGTLLTGFLLLPVLGVSRTSLLAAAVNIGLGILALIFSRSKSLVPSAGNLAEGWIDTAGPAKGPQPAKSPQEDRPGASALSGDVQPVHDRVRPGSPDGPQAEARALRPARPDLASGPSRGLVLSVFAFSGFAAMLCEVGWSRVLALTIGSSVYGFTLMLAAFLAGLAGGAAVFARLLDRWRLDPGKALPLVLAGAAAASWGTAILLSELPYLFARIYTWTAGTVFLMFVGQMAVCLLAMFPATFVMGAVFPLVLRLQARSGAGVGRPVGESYASNTLGTVLGAAIAGFVLVPVLGVRPTLYAAIGIYLVLAALVAAHLPRGLRVFLPVGAVAVAGALFVLSPGWNTREMMSGVYLSAHNLQSGFSRRSFNEVIVGQDTIVYYEEGINANVMVAIDSGDTITSQLYLKVNGKTDATSASDLDTQILLGQLPFLFCPQAKKALVIGLGSGITVASVATHELDAIRVLEVEPAMVGAAHCFDKFNRSVLSDPRVEVVINDARNDLLLRDQSYDIIVSEPSNPWMTVAANLFTRDFFQSARARLAPGGVFSQWVQTYRMSSEDLRTLIATYRSVFPNVLVFGTSRGLSDLVLIGSDSPLPVDYSLLVERVSDLRVGVDLGRVGLRQPEQILALLLLGPPGLDGYVEGAVLNTDDNARIEFSAPLNLLVKPDSDSLRAMYPHRIRLPEVLVGLPEDPAESRRVLLDLAEALVKNERLSAALDVLDAADAIGPDERSRILRSTVESRRAKPSPSTS